MHRTDALDYLNTDPSQGLTNLDITMMRLFINLKHSKWVTDMQLIQFFNGNPFNAGHFYNNFRANLARHFEINSIHDKTGKLIKYV